ncbi:PilW family protein [Massilia sp. Root351]|uniref:PilW family protein n=1 Tax=Massilia sp. Root351 TaxID=1736522 RepID=UPI000B1E5B84|nr:PilW family protein [Massilia sp. Root351]
MNGAGDAIQRAAAPLRRRSMQHGTARRNAAMRGLGLVEMLVALAVGMLVTLAASALVVNASANYVHHTESARLNDSGRYALAMVGQAVRQAAFVNWDAAGVPPATLPEASANISGLDAASISRTSTGIDEPLANAVNGSDVLALRFAGSGSPDADGSVLNCAGFGTAAAGTEAQRGWSIFYVAAGGDGVAELRCKYKSANSWGADAIVRGVDSFQVLYGIDTDTPSDGIPNRYLNASAVRALDAELVLEGATAAARAQDLNRKTWWKRVASIKVGLLLHGEAHSRPGAETAPYDLLGGAYSATAAERDRGVRIQESLLPEVQRQRVRRLFEASIALRNPGGP